MKNLINSDSTINRALKLLDDSALKLLMVVDKSNKLLGTCSDGDIRRLLLKGVPLDHPIESGYYKNPTVMLMSDFNEEAAIQLCQDNHILGVPIVDENHTVTDFFSLDKGRSIMVDKPMFDIPVIIMGGGKGTRLQPISDVFPKPLIPIKGVPMVEHVMNYFKSNNLKNFFLTLNHKAELIKAYFNGAKQGLNVTFVEEPTFMGTAGSLSLLNGQLDGDFIISNCDCLVQIDIHDAIKQHKDNDADLTVITSIQNHQVPYGVIHYENGGRITKVDEKPQLSFPMNTGVYIANSRILKYIDSSQLFHMTHLIDELIANNKKVSCYFISEKEFVDFGQWDEYKKSAALIS